MDECGQRQRGYSDSLAPASGSFGQEFNELRLAQLPGPDWDLRIARTSFS